MTRVLLLRVLPLITLVLVGLKAAGLMPRQRTPREIAEAFERGAAAPQAPGRRSLFTDVAPSMGLAFMHDNGARGDFHLPEEMGPGCALADLDGDGDLDAFVTGGGAVAGGGPVQSCRLFRNDGEAFTDITVAAGAGVPGPAYGVACADYDDDGDVDVFVTRLGADELLRNDGGRFTRAGAAAGVDAGGFGASAAFFDYDRDGLLDLYVTRYVDWSAARETQCFTILGVRDYCNPTTYDAASRDLLYRNVGDGRFEDVSEAAGIAAEAGNGLGVLVSDFDGDGWMDVYVANDQTPAFLWRNRGNGTFENVAVLAGCAYDGRGVAIAGMGTAGQDFDFDGDIDVLVTNIHDQAHLLLRNDGGNFEDASLGMGLGRFSIPATAFGVAVFDQDNDGALDAFFANGEVNVNNAMPAAGPNPYAQPDHFVRLVEGMFVDATAGSGAAFGDVGRGVAAGDFDDDGDVDLLVANNGGPLRLLRNEHRGGGAWLGVAARRGPGGRHAIGARLTVTAGGRRFVREVRPQESYLSSGDPRVHFGLGGALRVERLEVRWPDGATTLRRDLPVNRYVELVGEPPP